MDMTRATFGALAVFGVAAAGGGAYLANRNSDVAPRTVVAASASAAVPGAVTETENAIAPAPTAVPPGAVAGDPAQAPAPVQPAKVARRAPVVARPQAVPERPRPTTNVPAGPTTTAPTYAPSAAPETSVAPSIEPVENTSVERAPVVPEAPRKVFDELVVPADSVIGLQLETAVASDRAKVEDEVRARVARDVRVRDQVAIPAGSRAEGSITLVERGGRLKDRARLGIRFHTIVLADGTRLPINTDTIYREGESPAKESAAKIGGAAVGGAVLGAIFGGKKGAVIGSTVGAAGGGVAVAASEPNTATFPAGSTVTVRMGSPATVTVER